MDEPVLTQHNHPQSIVFLWFTLGVVRSMGLDECIRHVSTIVVSYRVVSLSEVSSVLCPFIPLSYPEPWEPLIFLLPLECQRFTHLEDALFLNTAVKQKQSTSCCCQPVTDVLIHQAQVFLPSPTSHGKLAGIGVAWRKGRSHRSRCPEDLSHLLILLTCVFLNFLSPISR